jgi:hypothetical protein
MVLSLLPQWGRGLRQEGIYPDDAAPHPDSLPSQGKGTFIAVAFTSHTPPELIRVVKTSAF